MKVFKNNISRESGLDNISAVRILHSYYYVNKAYEAVNPDWKQNSGECWIERRHQLRHAKRELFNIFNALTGLI